MVKGQGPVRYPVRRALHQGHGLIMVNRSTKHEISDSPAQGVVATATVLAQGKQEIVTLQPAAGNVMRGRGAFMAQPGLKVVVSLTLPGQRPQLGRYAPFG